MNNLEKDIEETTVFFYYQDLERASKFYKEVLGLRLVTDLGWVKIYRITDNANVGLVDENMGYLKSTKDKPVMLTLSVRNIEKWYKYILENEVRIEAELKKHQELDQRLFLIKDTEGYIIEFMEFK
jgi:predicted enzyme related to lactoylglutathione lyase